jgi:hypothetical protein
VPQIVSNAPVVAGKSPEIVRPASHAPPDPSIATPQAPLEPPRYVEYRSSEPSAESFVRKAAAASGSVEGKAVW